MIGDFGLYGGYFEFEWFQPNISVRPSFVIYFSVPSLADLCCCCCCCCCCCGQGIYPTLIILVVSHHKSSSETIFSLGRAPSCTADDRPIEFGFPQSIAKDSYKESDENELSDVTVGTVPSNRVVDYRDEV